MSEYRPLSEAAPALAAHLLEFQHPQPVSIAERVGVDMKYLGRMGSWSGFLRDVQIGPMADALDETPVNAIGVDNYDTETAGDIADSRTQLSSAEFESPRKGLRRRTLLQLNVNVGLIKQQMADTETPAHDPEAWVGPIEQGLRQSVRAAAWRHLVTRTPINEYERPLTLQLATLLPLPFETNFGWESIVADVAVISTLKLWSIGVPDILSWFIRSFPF